MTDFQSRLDTLARRLQTVITTASQPSPPITQLEAYEQMVEELELAGYGAAVALGDLSPTEMADLRRQAAN
jgi:hypothetical protein